MWSPISGAPCAFDARCLTYGGYGGPQNGVCQNGLCFNSMATTASCDDFDPCTSGDMCTQFGCKGQPIPCDSTDPCQEPVGTCIPVPAKSRRPGTGGGGYECQFTQKPIGTPCGSDDLCFTNFVCTECGDCEGTPKCNNPPACYVLPGNCNPQDGACTYTFDSVYGTPCDDGLSCTTDVCDDKLLACTSTLVDGYCLIGGVCVSDGDSHPTNKCLVCDTQSSTTDWTPLATGESCSDNNACNGEEVCQQSDPDGGPVTSTCVPGTPIVCNSPPTCYTGPGQCDTKTGDCTYNEVELGTPCPDGDQCNGTETCQRQPFDRRPGGAPPAPLVCSPGTPVVCDAPPRCHTAQNASCDPTTGLCNYPNLGNGTPCSDPALCSDTATCQEGTCTASSGQNCNDNNPCTADLCDEEGCTHSNVANGTPCSNGNACDGAETCQNGVCSAGTAVVCNSPPPCHTATGATCNPSTGQCTYPNAADGTSCADNDLCNGNETCVAGQCTAGTPVLCNSPPVCRTSNGATCDPATGQCTYPLAANGTSCSDGNACNGAETCQSGACVAGTPKVCNAPPVCHSAEGAICDPQTGQCGYPVQTNGTSCSDGNPCNGLETCQSGVCTPGVAVVCTQPPPCRIAEGAACDPQTGLCDYPTASNGTSCSDGNACNGLETCVGGNCVAGTPIECTQPPVCRSAAGVCNPQSSMCEYPALPNGSSCSDGNPCNGVETCQQGVCVAGTPVACTAPPVCHTATGATCDRASGGCVYPAATNGTPCPDNDACNGAETCQSGVCTAGAPLNCDDGNPCTVDSCQPGSGCAHTAASNGSACGSDGRTCQQGQCAARQPNYSATGTSCFSCGAGGDSSRPGGAPFLMLILTLAAVRWRGRRRTRGLG